MSPAKEKNKKEGNKDDDNKNKSSSSLIDLGGDVIENERGILFEILKNILNIVIDLPEMNKTLFHEKIIDSILQFIFNTDLIKKDN